MSSDDMRDEYDFPKAARGKFHRPNASLAPPIHLEPEVLAFLTARCMQRNACFSALNASFSSSDSSSRTSSSDR